MAVLTGERMFLTNVAIRKQEMVMDASGIVVNNRQYRLLDCFLNSEITKDQAER